MTRKHKVKVCPLASGSKGNSLYISFGDTAVLVDAGLSGVDVERRMARRDISPAALRAIIITHEHADHVRGAGVLSRRFSLPLYITQGTFQACASLGKISDLRFFECGSPFYIDQIRVSPFSTSHDAHDSAGLTFENMGIKVGVATDLGVVTQLVKIHLARSHLLYLESNHDPDMLMNGPYPWRLKQRIKGRTGHLSNPDAAHLAAELTGETLQHVVLAHLSEENNHPSIAESVMTATLNGSGVTVHVAGPDAPGEMIVI